MTKKEKSMLEAYQQAINKIDDYFEYDRMPLVIGNREYESGKTFKECQEKVKGILDELTLKLVNLSE